MSFVELLIVVSAIGSLVSLGLVLFGALQDNAKDQKFESDVLTINRALSTLTMFGGNLDVNNFSDVLSRLKSQVANAEVKETVGLSSSLVDVRLEPVMQTAEEAATNMPRAFWDKDSGKLVISNTGPAGIKEFRLNEDLANSAPVIASRESSFDFGAGWIWKYENDYMPTDPVAPTAVTLTEATSTVSDPLLVSVAAPLTAPPSPPSALSPPYVLLASGSYPISQFPLNVPISNPNPAGTSTISYSIDSGTWAALVGTEIAVGPDQVLRVQAVPVDTNWTASAVVEKQYTASPEALLPPTITHDGPFSNPQVNPVTVTISHSNDSAVSEIAYQIDGGGWLAYSGPFALNSSDYPLGAQITAMTVPMASYYVQSSQVTSHIPVDLAAPSPPVELTTGIDAGSWSISGATATYTFTDDGTSVVLTETGTSWSTGSINSWGAWSQPVDGTGSVQAIFDAGDSFTMQVLDASSQPISPDSIELHLDRLGGSSGAGVFTLQSGSWAGTSGNSGFASTSTTVQTSLGGTNQSGGSIKLNDSVSSMAIVNGGATDMIAFQVTISLGGN